MSIWVDHFRIATHIEYDTSAASMLVPVQWSNEHSYTCWSGFEWTHCTDLYQDQYIVRVAVANCKASTAYIRVMVVKGVSTLTIGNCLLITEQRHVYQVRLLLTL